MRALHSSERLYKGSEEPLDWEGYIFERNCSAHPRPTRGHLQLSEELLRPDPVPSHALLVLGVPVQTASKAKGRYSVVTWST